MYYEITKREVLASISIVAILLLMGVLISTKISEHQMDKNEIYNKAVKIEETEIFQYGMDTNIGNAFVYGNLEAVDTVTYPEIGEQYMYIKKVKERYTMHTRTYTVTVNGKTQTCTETYWSWDVVGSENKRCKEVKFCEVVFSSDKINLPSAGYIDTIKESSHIRYKYYGTDPSHTGTIFTKLQDGTISASTKFYENKTIDETVEMLEQKCGTIVFWVFWCVLMCACVLWILLFGKRMVRKVKNNDKWR